MFNISAKTEYACIAVLELAGSYGSGAPVPLRDIAGKHGVPSKFLVQILLQLKAAGLVSSTRGAAGGYKLLKDPATLTLCEVISAIDPLPAEFNSNAAVATPESAALCETWCSMAQQQRESLQAITFAELLDRAASQHMYYI